MSIGTDYRTESLVFCHQKEKTKEDISMMTPTTLLLTVLGVCTVSAQLMKFLIWVDEPSRSH